MLISVDFWKSMHGFAMDSRTRDAQRYRDEPADPFCTETKALHSIHRENSS